MTISAVSPIVVGLSAVSRTNPNPGLLSSAAFYADTLSAGSLTSWPDASGNGRGLTLAGGTVTATTDSRNGQKLVRFAAGATMQAAAGKFDFLHQQDCTVIMAWRTQDFTFGAAQPLLWTSTGPTSKGWRLVADDSTSKKSGLLTQISDGSTNIMAEPAATLFGVYPSLLWNVAAVTHSPTRAAVSVDGQQAYIDTLSLTLPTGAAANPLTIGNARFEVAAIEIYSPALSDTARDAAVATLATRCNVAPVVALWKSPGTTLNPTPGLNRYYAFPSMCVRADGKLLAACRNGLAHSGDIGTFEARVGTFTGNPVAPVTWGPAYTILSGQTVDPRDPCLVTLGNGDILCTYFLNDSINSTTAYLRTMRSSDNGATWSSPATVSSSFTSQAAASGPAVINGTNLIWPIYGLNIGDAHTSADVLVSANNGVTWSAQHRIMDGVADSADYQEPNIFTVSGSNMRAEVRQGAPLVNAKEALSSDGGTTWGSVTLGSRTQSAQRGIMASDGGMYLLARSSSLGNVNGIYRRVAAGDWSGGWPLGDGDFPTFLDATPASGLYGTLIEFPTGTLNVLYGVNIGTLQAEIRFRTWPLGMARALDTAALGISPSAATIAPLGVQLFAPTGGVSPYIFSMPTAPSGGNINAINGTYTAGSTGNVHDLPQVADYLDNVAAANVTVSTAIAPHNISASCMLEMDPSVSLTADQSGQGHNLTNTGAATIGTGIGGQPSFEFDGVGNYLAGPAISNLVAAAAWTMYFTVVDHGSPADGANYFSDAEVMGDGSSAAGGYWMSSISATKVRFGQSTTTPANVDGATTTISASTIYRFIMKYDGTKMYVSVNGGAFDAGTVAANIADRTHLLNVGRAAISGTKFAKMSLGVYGAFNTSLAGDPTSVGTDCYKLYQYMLAKG